MIARKGASLLDMEGGWEENGVEPMEDWGLVGEGQKPGEWREVRERSRSY